MINHVVDLPTAKKLGDYLPEGWESEHYWIKPDDVDYSLTLHDNAHLIPDGCTTGWIHENLTCPAPILEEMLELLPKRIASKQMTDIEMLSSSAEYLYSRMITPYYIHYHSDKYGILKGGSFCYKDTNLATAAAKLYMWLVDEGHLKEGHDEINR